MLKVLKNRKIVIVFLVLLVGIGVGLSLFAKEESPEEAIETVKVRKEDLVLTISVPGSIDAKEQAEVRFQTSGQLAWVGVSEGDQVKKWQALASLDRRELKKRLEKQLNDFMTQRLSFDQAHDDYQEEKDNAVITKEIERILDKAQLSLSNRVIEVELIDLALKYATIHSPLDGIVTKIDSPLPGINITPAQATFFVVNPDSLAFYLTVNETEVVGLKEGQKVDIRLDAFPDRNFVGSISRVGFTPLAGQGTYYQVIVSFLEKEPEFKIGMNGDGEILIEKKEGVLIVPETALIKRDGEYSVFTVVNDRAKKQPVTVGLITDRGAEVIEGLTEGEIVISSGISKISDGQRI